MANQSTDEDPRTQSALETQAVTPSEPRLVNAEEFLRGEDEVRILHLGQIYRLRRTRNGKLLLHK